ncbi:hypothetical protein M409DRAFT_27737 [Zasmidium cellare ATCC 36951]|uniref:Histone deacetylase domain-containing protein n=1 Tax=Zasmidium cellare ATCC 36951 TaxID=1080233 RepID=A0A6A6C7Y8_ZASCE|nr:uncharacterized protein M409DRAFT_27737 [Zasmidium cellare ATCC 36951]KAF2162012.1 hypothetical protein M409DRAFT_27737 [Zasmidium cellare ATCC 36951]
MASHAPTDPDQQAQAASEPRPPDGIKLDTDDLSDALRHMSVATAASDTYSPMSSAPPTPGLKTPLSRRTSQPATSPITKDSPRTSNAPYLPRRPSSSASVSRPPSSPRLMKKGSRTSLGGPDDQERRPTPKRSISNLISGLREAQATMEPIEEPIPLTAPQIAADHFSRELLGHERPESDAETIVILHDACYGHRFSRLKTTKTSLSMIVERPERIHASVLGASTAYVRLGGHHAGAKRSPHPDNRELSNPPFKIRRSARSMDITSTYVTNVHGTAWMSELQGLCHSAGEKLAAGAKELSRTSTPGEPEKERLHEGDLYLAPESLNAFQGALGGVADAIDKIFEPGTNTKRAFVAVRPPGHHCSADHPSGFCWLNNVHVGIEYAAQTHGLTHAAILDFDLHHGDGSQAITWERNSKNNVKRLNAKPNSKLKLSPDIGYYSIHDINSYPCEMGDDEKVQAASLCIENAHGQSIWNVHLQTWKTEDEFWKLYEERYSVLLDKAKVFLKHHAQRLKEGKVQPKTAIFISAGFDASEWEGSGMQRHKVNVPTEFYARITRDVVKLAEETEGCEGRVISVLEGGYSDRALCSGVLSHLSGLCASPVTPDTAGVEDLMDLSSQMNGLSLSTSLTYDKTWWSADNLTALENKVNPPPPPQAKKMRGGPQPTYATPTESFAYKVLDPQKFARSISGTMREAPLAARPPTPPIPEVDWVVATQELSKLLIPIGRQTKSCTVEELEVPRAKKEPQTTAQPSEVGQPRQLRDRRAKGPVYAESAHSDETASVRSVSRSESRASRRETIDVLPTQDAAPTQQRRASRRQSAGSALGSTDAPVDHDAPPVPAIPSRPPMSSRTSSNTVGTMKPPPIPTPNPQAVNKKVRAPSQNRKRDAIGGGPLTSAPKATSTVSNKAIGGDAKTSDVDRLASGLKKVTLKVSSTKEEHDRKQKEKLDAERRARALKGAETRRINAAAKKAAKEGAVPQKQPLAPVSTGLAKSETQAGAVVSTAQNDGDIARADDSVAEPAFAQTTEMLADTSGWGMPSLTTENTGPIIADAPVDSLSNEPMHVPERKPTPIEVPTSLGTPAEDLEFPEYANSGGSASVSPALKPEDGPTYPAQQLPSPAGSELKVGAGSNVRSTSSYSPSWMKPAAHTSSNGSPVSPKRTPSSPIRPSSSRQLPTFSSTGHIPFGPTPTSPERKTLRSPPKSLWKHNPMDGEGGIVGNGVGSSMLTEQLEKKSIWDVPDTPAK